MKTKIWLALFLFLIVFLVSSISIVSKKFFPSENINPNQLVRMFKESKFAFERTPTGQAKTAFSVSTSFFPKEFKVAVTSPKEGGGLFVSPSASLAFARIKGEKIPKTEIALFGLEREKFAQVLTPRVGFGRIPTSERVTRTKAAEFLLSSKSEKTGKAFVSPFFEFGKTELEAIIPVGTGFKQVFQTRGVSGFVSRLRGFETFTTVAGERLPIRVFEPNQGTIKKGTKGTVLPEVSGERAFESKFVFTPERVGLRSRSVSEAGRSSSVLAGESGRGLLNFSRSFLNDFSSRLGSGVSRRAFVGLPSRFFTGSPLRPIISKNPELMQEYAQQVKLNYKKAVLNG